MNPSSVVKKSIIKVNGADRDHLDDVLSVEEPLEIRLGFGPLERRMKKSLAITMRTPGHDQELAIGFLFSEGIIESSEDFVLKSVHTDDLRPDDNYITIELHPSIDLDWERFSRHFYTNSSCGICGKSSIESLENMCTHLPSTDFQIDARYIHQLNERMRAAQGVFDRTGSLHAAALFDHHGQLLFLREDIGRHNALDKVIGAAMLSGSLPLNKHVVMLSGRSCFELVHKALMAEVPILAAVGAPSSLAVDTADQFGMTLLGFTKNNTFNIYSSPEKIVYETAH